MYDASMTSLDSLASQRDILLWDEQRRQDADGPCDVDPTKVAERLLPIAKVRDPGVTIERLTDYIKKGIPKLNS